MQFHAEMQENGEIDPSFDENQPTPPETEEYHDKQGDPKEIGGKGVGIHRADGPPLHADPGNDVQ
tara:strand:+ start:1228 stop:1422 length:195 start_codon:yes stop_codon:yes gene_type:complete